MKAAGPLGDTTDSNISAKINKVGKNTQPKFSCIIDFMKKL